MFTFNLQELIEDILVMFDVELQDKNQKVQDLQRECDTLKKAAVVKDEQISDLRKRWVKTAKELDRFRANSQGFYQITDEYLTGQISHLRLAIRDLSIQYFDGKSTRQRLRFLRPHYLCHLRAISEHDYHAYISSPEYCHKAVQAFIWHVIVKEVLDKFEWAGEENSKNFLRVWLTFRPPRRTGPEGQLLSLDSEAERKFQTWRATTTALFLENMDAESADNYIKLRASQHAQLIINTLSGLINKEEHDGLKDQLVTIIYQAFTLDREISRQSGHVVWQFHGTQHHETSGNAQRRGDAGLVTSPAVFKRGKSTGEDYNHVTTLLEAEIDYRK